MPEEKKGERLFERIEELLPAPPPDPPLPRFIVKRLRERMEK